MYRDGVCVLLSLFGAAETFAATPAGTRISNIAHISYRLDAGSFSISSNLVEFRVGEIIQFSVSPAPSCGGAAPDGRVAIGFDVTNLGNGNEAFVPGVPKLTGGNFDVAGVYVDGNANGCYDPDIDPLIAAGDGTPPIAPGKSVRIFLVGVPGAGAGGGTVVLPITSGTGSGGVGTAIVGAGDGGGDAVMGPGGGVVADVAAPLPGGQLAASLVKSQSVTASDGSAKPRQGAIVTYSLEGRFAGIGRATGAMIADVIPAGTTYVPGSLALDGASLSDAQDDDAGSFDGQRIEVSLGDVAAPAVRTIRFQVRIQ